MSPEGEPLGVGPFDTLSIDNAQKTKVISFPHSLKAPRIDMRCLLKKHCLGIVYLAVTLLWAMPCTLNAQESANPVGAGSSSNTTIESEISSLNLAIDILQAEAKKQPEDQRQSIESAIQVLEKFLLSKARTIRQTNPKVLERTQVQGTFNTKIPTASSEGQAGKLKPVSAPIAEKAKGTTVAAQTDSAETPAAKDSISATGDAATVSEIALFNNWANALQTIPGTLSSEQEAVVAKTIDGIKSEVSAKADLIGLTATQLAEKKKKSTPNPTEQLAVVVVGGVEQSGYASLPNQTNPFVNAFFRSRDSGLPTPWAKKQDAECKEQYAECKKQGAGCKKQDDACKKQDDACVEHFAACEKQVADRCKKQNENDPDKDPRCKHPWLYGSAWGRVRLLSAPQHATNGIATVFTDPQGQITKADYSKVGEAADFALGFEVKPFKDWQNVSLLAFGGATTPLNSQNVTLFYNIPAAGTVECKTLLQRYPTLQGYGSGSGCVSSYTYLALSNQDRTNFFPKYGAGLRLTPWKDSTTNAFNGVLDITIGQDSSVTGGILKHPVFKLDGLFPFPKANAIYVFGSASIRATSNGNYSPLILSSPSTTPTVPSASVLVVPLQQANRDFYRIGVGLDLKTIFSKLVAATGSSPAAADAKQ